MIKEVEKIMDFVDVETMLLVVDERQSILYSCEYVFKGDFTVNGVDPSFNSQGGAVLKVGDVVAGDNVNFIVKGLEL